jgi:glycosyltransferase involved in cell wall biosynthesis
MRAPLISVVIPVYNGERYLALALNSILQQTFTDFELIAIDDGSSDSTPQILQRYASADPRVVVVVGPRRGLIQVLNQGIRMARGQFLARMDADDIALSRRFERQIQYLNDHPECVAVGCAAHIIDKDGKVKGKIDIDTSHEVIDRNYLMMGSAFGIPHPTAMIRREAIIQANGYREQFRAAEDVDLFLRLAERGRLANLPEELLLYRAHGDSVSHLYRKVQTQSAEAAILEAYRRRQLPIPRELRRQFARCALANGRMGASRSWAFSAVFHDARNREGWQLLAVALFPVSQAGRFPKWLDIPRLCRSLCRRGISFVGDILSRT